MINKGELLVSARQKIALLLSVLLLNSCSTNAEYKTEQPWAWSISVTMPSFYPANVTQVYGVNDKENWTALLHGYLHTMRNSELKRIQERFTDYDGFGLSLLNTTMGVQIGTGTTHLPDTLYLYWVSLFDTKFYVTKYEIPTSVKQLIATKTTYTRRDGAIVDSCYRAEFIFGLLPNGQAKVWLSGCGETIYLTELAPDQILDRDSNGVKFDSYRKSSSFADVQQRAKDAGVELEPIPWDKVNKVYSINEIKTLGE
ncbi:nitroreductase [Vibrio cholerae]|nr:nitroreductase [Vibrio cholerae]